MSIFRLSLSPVMLFEFACFLVLLLLQIAVIQSVPVSLHAQSWSLPLRNTNEDFHFEDETPIDGMRMLHQSDGSSGVLPTPTNRFMSESKFFQWPPSKPIRVLGLGLLLGSVLTYSLFCCVKKRSGSYGERSSSIPTLKIYRLKPEKGCGCSEIPEPSHGSGRAGESQSQSLRYSPSPSPTALEQPQLLRIHEGTIKTDPKCKVILKGDISPPIATTTTRTTTSLGLRSERDREPGQSPKFHRMFAFTNPDPSKEPLKPFTYSPIPPVRPVRSKSNAASSTDGKSGNSSAPVKRSGSGLPFSNPDPVREPLKPFTYSPIPTRPN